MGHFIFVVHNAICEGLGQEGVVNESSGAQSRERPNIWGMLSRSRKSSGATVFGKDGHSGGVDDSHQSAQFISSNFVFPLVSRT